MDLRTLTKLALKLAGLYVLMSAIVAVPGIFSLPHPYGVANAFWSVSYCIAGLALQCFIVSHGSEQGVYQSKKSKYDSEPDR